MPELSVLERLAASTMGALITSITMTPFDVIKTRMQLDSAAHQALSSKAPQDPISGPCTHFRYFNGLQDMWIRKDSTAEIFSQPARQRFHTYACDCHSSTWRSGLRIMQEEGVRSLWSGLGPTLVLAIPSTAVYFTAYDMLLPRVRSAVEHGGMSGISWMSPVFAGSFARIIAVSAFSPLEMVRTRMWGGEPLRDVLQSLRVMASEDGLRSLWRGLQATLFRDVVFSGIYWLGFEEIRAALAESGHKDQVTAAFISGAVSGSIAAVSTHPFDIVKTRVQVISFDPSYAANHRGNAMATSLIGTMRDIVATEGWRQLYVGLGARVFKVAPSCAIMIGTKEFVQQRLEPDNAELR